MRKRDKRHACKDPWYKGLKHVVQKKLRSAYYQYVEDIINPCDNDNRLEANKHFFSLLNHAKSDNTGVHPLKNNRTLISDPKGKALLLNTYFQSVFTRESPLSRKKHGQKTILDNTQEDSTPQYQKSSLLVMGSLDFWRIWNHVRQLVQMTSCLLS